MSRPARQPDCRRSATRRDERRTGALSQRRSNVEADHGRVARDVYATSHRRTAKIPRVRYAATISLIENSERIARRLRLLLNNHRRRLSATIEQGLEPLVTFAVAQLQSRAPIAAK